MGNTDTLSCTDTVIQTSQHKHAPLLIAALRSQQMRAVLNTELPGTVHVALEARSYTYVDAAEMRNRRRPDSVCMTGVSNESACLVMRPWTLPRVTAISKVILGHCRFSATRAVLNEACASTLLASGNEACASTLLASGTATSSPLTATAVLLRHHCARISADPISRELQSSIISAVGPAASHQKRYTRRYSSVWMTPPAPAPARSASAPEGRVGSGSSSSSSSSSCLFIYCIESHVHTNWHKNI